MTSRAATIVIRRGDPNGPQSRVYSQALNDYLETIPEFANLKGPRMGGAGSPRPHVLPQGSVLLYAVEEAAAAAADAGDDNDHDDRSDNDTARLIGSLCIMPLHAGTVGFRGLPHDDIDQAGEIKRMIVFPGHRGKGVARALIAEAERVARAEMGVSYMVVETLWLLTGAQGLYRAAGYRERDVWGGYVREDSVCFEKWL